MILSFARKLLILTLGFFLTQTAHTITIEEYVATLAVQSDTAITVFNNFQLTPFQKEYMVKDIHSNMRFIAQYCELNPQFLEAHNSVLNGLFRRYQRFVKAGN